MMSEGWGLVFDSCCFGCSGVNDELLGRRLRPRGSGLRGRTVLPALPRPRRAVVRESVSAQGTVIDHSPGIVSSPSRSRKLSIEPLVVLFQSLLKGRELL